MEQEKPERVVSLAVRITEDEYNLLVALGQKQSVPVKPSTMLRHLLRVALGLGS